MGTGGKVALVLVGTGTVAAIYWYRDELKRALLQRDMQQQLELQKISENEQKSFEQKMATPGDTSVFFKKTVGVLR